MITSRPARLVEVIEDAHDRCALDDEGDQPQRAATTPAAQRIDFVDACDQPRPGAGAGWCGRYGFRKGLDGRCSAGGDPDRPTPMATRECATFRPSG
jgi:hypothetical protein